MASRSEAGISGGSLTLPPSGEGTPAPPEEGPPRPAEPLPFPVVDPAHYEIEGEFARGGLGRVLLARDLRLGRTVALKEILRPSPRTVARFAREVQISARLQHPSIVTIYEAGCWPTGESFYAMKLVEGRPLSQAIEGAPGLAERLAFLPNLAAAVEALAYAHSRRVIHRDIKPENVLIGNFGETVVIDWGLAKDLDEEEGEAVAFESRPAQPADLTVAGAVLGTPSYMAPEQARGEPLDERADVYALGGLLYFSLSTRPPFGGSTGEQPLAQRAAAPPPLASLVPEVPRDLDQIVRKAMAPRREDRYRTAAELAEDLQKFQTGQLISARSYPWWIRAGRWLKRHRALAAAALAAAASAAAVGGVSLRRVLHERNRAELALVEARARSDELVLAHAQSALDRDPTASIAWLRQYPEVADALTRRNLILEAESRGVARHVLAPRNGYPGPMLFDRASKTLILPSYTCLSRWDMERGTELPGPAMPRAICGSIEQSGDEMLVGDSEGRVWRGQLSSGPLLQLTQFAVSHTSVIAAPRSPIAAALNGGALSLIDLRSGSTRRLGEGEGAVLAAVLSPGGSWALSAGADLAVRRWDTATAQGRVLWRHQAPLRQVAVSPEGAWLASASEDGEIRVAPAEGDPERAARTLQGHQRPVVALAFSPDGSRLASADASGRVVRWETASGQGQPLDLLPAKPLALAFSPDGALLATGSEDEVARLWSDDGSLAWSAYHRGLDGPLAFSPDGRWLISQSGDDSKRVWPVPRPSRPLIVGKPVFHAVFSPDGRHLATDGEDGSVRLWDTSTGRGHKLGSHKARSYGLAFSPDSRLLVSASQDGTLGLWDLATQQYRMVQAHQGAILYLTFLSSRPVLSSNSRDGTFRVWDVLSDQAELLGQDLPPSRYSTFSPDGRRAASFHADRSLYLWDMEQRTHRKLASDLGLPSDFSFLCAFSLDGARVACCDRDRTLSVWLVDSGAKTSWPLPPGEPGCNRLAFSASGDLGLPIGKNLLILDPQGGASRLLQGHADQIHNFHFSADGRLAATAGVDRTIRIWNIHTGASLIAHRHQGAVFDAAISPDGRMAASVSQDGTAWLGPLAEESMLRPERGELERRIEALSTAQIVDGAPRTPGVR